MIELELHPSGVGGFFECPYRWYRDNLHKPIRRVGSAAHFGTGVHKAAETFYSEVISENTWKGYNSAYGDAAVESFRNRLKDDEPDDIKEIKQDDIENELVKLSKKYIENAQFLGEIPKAVENNYKVKLSTPENLNISISGTLDIEYKNAIGDIKTMNKLNNPSKYTMQQGIYAVIKEMETKEKVEDLRIHRVVRPKQTIDSVSILGSTKNPYTTIDDIKFYCKSTIHTIVRTLNEFDKTGSELLFRGNPNSMLCSEKYCQYYKECKWKL